MAKHKGGPVKVEMLPVSQMGGEYLELRRHLEERIARSVGIQMPDGSTVGGDRPVVAADAYINPMWKDRQR